MFFRKFSCVVRARKRFGVALRNEMSQRNRTSVLAYRASYSSETKILQWNSKHVDFIIIKKLWYNNTQAKTQAQTQRIHRFLGHFRLRSNDASVVRSHMEIYIPILYEKNQSTGFPLVSRHETAAKVGAARKAPRQKNKSAVRIFASNTEPLNWIWELNTVFVAESAQKDCVRGRTAAHRRLISHQSIKFHLSYSIQDISVWMEPITPRTASWFVTFRSRKTFFGGPISKVVLYNSMNHQ